MPPSSFSIAFLHRIGPPSQGAAEVNSVAIGPSVTSTPLSSSVTSTWLKPTHSGDTTASSARMRSMENFTSCAFTVPKPLVHGRPSTRRKRTWVSSRYSSSSHAVPSSQSHCLPGLISTSFSVAADRMSYSARLTMR